jgi:hypothetical protein
LPEPSIARTEKVCEPGVSGPVACGDVHAAKTAASTRHSNVPVSLAVNVNVAVSAVVEAGGLPVIVVSGAT